MQNYKEMSRKQLKNEEFFVSLQKEKLH